MAARIACLVILLSGCSTVPPAVFSETPAMANASCDVVVDSEVVAQYPYPASGDPLDAVLPNSRQYVMGSMLRPANETDGQEQFRCVCEDCTEDELTHLVRINVAPGGACAAGDGDVSWSARLSADVDGTGLSLDVSSSDPYVCLPEGKHHLAVAGHTSANGNVIASFEKSLSVPVKNLLIVAIGDSYSSGQGSPAARVTASPWPFVDDGDSNDFEHLVPQGSRVTPLWQRQTFSELPLVQSGERIRIDPWDSKVMTHFEAHRSPFAPASLAAMALEEDSKDSSVTFVNLAETGATIKLGALEPGCVAETGCAARFQASQLARVKALTSGRSIDALVVGFGGNDTGFAKVVVSLVGREPGLGVVRYDSPGKDEIREAITSGSWSAIIEGEDPVAGMSRLPDEYSRLNSELRESLAAELSNAEIFLLGYPGPHKKQGPRNKNSSYCEFFRNLARYVDEDAGRSVADTLFGQVGRLWDFTSIPGSKRVRLRVDEDEARFAHSAFFLPLKEKQIAAADAYGWNFVDMSGRFESHTICAGRPYPIHRRDSYAPRLPPPDLPNRWFRAGIEGFLISGAHNGQMSGNRGLLHPNEGGYGEMSRLLLASLRQKLYPQPKLVWSALTTDTIDGQQCPDFGLPGCGPIGSPCEPINEICLDDIHQDTGNECRYSTMRCRRVICEAGSNFDCDVPNGLGQQACNETGTGLGSCVVVSCDDGYIRNGNRCQLPACNAGAVKDCSDDIENALDAFRTCRADRTGFGRCKLNACMPGYRPSGNACVYDGSTQPNSDN